MAGFNANMPLVQATNTLTNFGCTCSSFRCARRRGPLRRPRAGAPEGCSSPCCTSISLLCPALGSGGIRPCVVALGIWAVGMLISIVVFLVGYPIYVKLKARGCPFTRLAQVVAAAFTQRDAAVPEDPGMLYQDKELDALISTNGRLLHRVE
ncbi:unnamed protein product [Urochloa humidicola]